MKSWRFHQFGDIQNLRMDEIPIPKPKPDEALVRLEYAGMAAAWSRNPETAAASRRATWW